MKTFNYFLISLIILVSPINGQTDLQVKSAKKFEGNKIYGSTSSVNLQNKKVTPIISPANQSICTGNAITSITATPLISDANALDCYSAITISFINKPNNGIFFDIKNNRDIPIRINGLLFITVTNIETINETIMPFSFYRTIDASSAVDNYTDQNKWTKIGTFNYKLPPTKLTSPAYELEIIFNDNGFTLAPNSSKGFYIVCENPATNGFRVAYRSFDDSQTPTSNTDLTVFHRARSINQSFIIESPIQQRGFLGEVYYNTGTFGYWSRNNLSNITGSGNAGDPISNNLPFPIEGSLINNTNTSETTTYTVISYDVNGIKDIQNAYVTVEAIPDNFVEVSGNTFTAIETDATYQWFRCDPVESLLNGATNKTYTPTVSGQYKVRIKKGACEIDSECLSITLKDNEFNLNDLISIYPNPAIDKIHIDSKIDLEILFYNTIGQQIKNNKLDNKTSFIMNLENLENGIYYIKGTTSNNESFVKKIIIDK